MRWSKLGQDVFLRKIVLFVFLFIYPKRSKNHTFCRRKFGPLFSFQYVWFWLPFHFNFFLLHSLLVRPSWGSDKSTHKSSPFFEFSRIMVYTMFINRSCITLMQDLLVSLAKILAILGFLAKKSKNFFGFLSKIWKNLAKSCEPCHE